MKRWFALGLAMLMAFSGVALADPAGSSMASTDRADGTDVLFSYENGHELAQDSAEQLDLDGDGVLETVTWRVNALNEYDEAVQVDVATPDGAVVSWQSSMLYCQRVYAVDLDGDGRTELFVTGDEMSDDYLTFCLRYSEGELRQLYFANTFRGGEAGAADQDAGYGLITAFGDNLIELNGSQDVLGTYFGSRQFTLKDDRFELEDDGLWHFERYASDDELWDYRSLTPKTAISATFVSGDVETAGALEAGEKIMITASDKISVAWFVTQDGREGYLKIEPNSEQGWGMLVNGISEDELFEYVPYAD